MSSYLDKAGLSRFWSAIKSYVDAHSGGVSLSSVYPVGSIYMSVNSTSPATLFGGTWERIQDRSSQAYAVYDSTEAYAVYDSTQAYAVYDSTDQSMTFFRDTPGKYTDGQVSGTKTYYAGFEDITGNTDPSWYDSSSDEQKNQIKTVTFKDKIKPKTCYDWFSNASSLASITGLDKLDTTAVKDMDYMFYRCAELTSLDLSSFNTENVMNMRSMFNSCRRLETIYASSLFTTDTVDSSSNMFDGCYSLVGGAGTRYDARNGDKTYAKIDGGASNPGYFTAKAVTPYLTIYMWKRTA